MGSLAITKGVKPVLELVSSGVLDTLHSSLLSLLGLHPSSATICSFVVTSLFC